MFMSGVCYVENPLATTITAGVTPLYLKSCKQCTTYLISTSFSPCVATLYTLFLNS